MLYLGMEYTSVPSEGRQKCACATPLCKEDCQPFKPLTELVALNRNLFLHFNLVADWAVGYTALHHDCL